VELSKTFGRKLLTDWMNDEDYTQENISAMVMHGDRVTSILTKDNKIHHSNGFVEPHIERLSAITRMETLAEEQDRKMAEKDVLIYKLAFIVKEYVDLFDDEKKKEIFIILNELRKVDSEQYNNLIEGGIHVGE